MVTRTFLLQQIERSFLTIVFGLTLLGVIGCGNSRAEHDIKPVEYVVKSATETPIEPTKENTSASVGPFQASLELVNKPLIQATPVITPGEPPELPLVRLPEKNVNAL
jgi:hypothetical protein